MNAATRARTARAFKCGWWGCTTAASSAGRLCGRHLGQRVRAATRPGPLRRRLLRAATRPVVVTAMRAIPLPLFEEAV